MLKYVVVVLLTAFSLPAKSQNLTFPAYFAGGEVPLYGVFFSDTLTNEGHTNARFYFNYQSKDSFGTNRADREKIFLRDSVFVQWLAGQANSTDPDERLLQYAKALGVFYKNPRNFRNYLNIAMPANFVVPDSGHARMNALNGGNASFHNMQCDDYARRGVSALYYLYTYHIDTVACFPSRYRQVQLPGHSVFEIWYRGAWAFVDIDPSTPGFMFSDGQGGYYGMQDLMNNPALVKADWVFMNDDNSPYEEIVPESTQAEDYQSYFTGTATYNQTMDQVMLTRPRGDAVSGEVVLPPKASMVFSYNNNALAVDVSKPENRDIINVATRYFDDYKESNDPVFLDSAYQLLGSHFSYQGVYADMIPDIAGRNAFGFYSKNWRPTFEQGEIKGTTLSYYIASGSDTLVIGRDLRGPFTVVGVKTDKPIVIGRQLVTDTFSVPLWGQPGTGGPTAIAYSRVNYLTSGFIPPHTTCRIDVAYNQGYLDWWNGYSIDTLDRADTLSLKRTQQVAVYNPATAIADNYQGQSDSRAIRLRPGQFMRRYPDCKQLIGVTGQTVPVTYYLPAGLYYMRANGTTIRVLIVH